MTERGKFKELPDMGRINGWIESNDEIHNGRRFLIGFFGQLFVVMYLFTIGSMTLGFLVLLVYAIGAYTHPYGVYLGYDRDWWNQPSSEERSHSGVGVYLLRFFGRSTIFVIGIIAIIGGIGAAYFGHECVQYYETVPGQAGRLFFESAQQEFITCHGLRLGGIITAVVGAIISLKV